MRWCLIIVCFIFCSSFVLAEGVINLSEVEENKSEIIKITAPSLDPWIEVYDIDSVNCNNDIVQPKVRGAFYLNYDSLVGCELVEYEIKLSIKRERFLFDETLYSDIVYSYCNYWDLVDDPLAPIKVSFDHAFSTSLDCIFQPNSVNENIYFKVEVVNRPEDFEFNFDNGDEAETDRYTFEFEDCLVVPECSSDNDCGTCRYCFYGDCYNSEMYTFAGYTDCDYLDTGCRDYDDAGNYCDGLGVVVFGQCRDYNNLAEGTSCDSGEGECDGYGNCIPVEDCVSHYSTGCSSGDVYWRDSCGNKEELIEACDYGCEDSACLPAPEIACYNDYDCGHVDDYYVCGGVQVAGWYTDLYLVKDYHQCWYDGTEQSFCWDQGQDVVFQQICPTICNEGACVEILGECAEDSHCPKDSSELICIGDDVFNQTYDNYCKYPNSFSAACKVNIKTDFFEGCLYGCENGVCFPEPDLFNYSADLEYGWNLISIPYDVSGRSLEEVFGGCWEGVNEVKDETKFYSRSLPVFLNTLDSLVSGKGYWVLMDEDCGLVVEDLVKVEECSFYISEGWNLIGSMFPDSVGLADFFGDNFDSVRQVKNEKEFYDSSLPSFLNTLTVLDFGSGYWVESDEVFEVEIC